MVYSAAGKSNISTGISATCIPFKNFDSHSQILNIGRYPRIPGNWHPIGGGSSQPSYPKSRILNPPPPHWSSPKKRPILNFICINILKIYQGKFQAGVVCISSHLSVCLSKYLGKKSEAWIIPCLFQIPHFIAAVSKSGTNTENSNQRMTVR